MLKKVDLHIHSTFSDGELTPMEILDICNKENINVISITDHDNFELKHVQDTLESVFLTNDTATLCSAFQCSHRGEMDSTCIWILTPEQFVEWLSTNADCWKTTPKN